MDTSTRGNLLHAMLFFGRIKTTKNNICVYTQNKNYIHHHSHTHNNNSFLYLFTVRTFPIKTTDDDDDKTNEATAKRPETKRREQEKLV